MPRRAARVDRNQAELVKVMRQMGASVEITSGAHDGFPDVVVGWGGVTVLVEVKDGDKIPSKRKLTPDQIVFHDRFKGAVTVIETEQQAIELVNRIRRLAGMIGPADWNLGAVASNG